MKIIDEIYSSWEIHDHLWSGGKDTAKYLDYEEIEQIMEMLDECYPEGINATTLNDFFWFESDTIAEWLGYESFDEIMERKKNEEE